MGIQDIPADLACFERLLDDYEAEQFHRNDSSRRIADVTLDLMATFPAQRMLPSSWVRRGAQALMDPQLIDALGYPPPNRRLVADRDVPDDLAADQRARAALRRAQSWARASAWAVRGRSYRCVMQTDFDFYVGVWDVQNRRLVKQACRVR